MRTPPSRLLVAALFALAAPSCCPPARESQGSAAPSMPSDMAESLRAPRVIGPEGEMGAVTWTAEELAKPIAAHRLHATESESMHLIHIGGAEPPHTHDQHDVVVVMLSGAAVLHLGDRAMAVKPGDVMEIPRGVPHWAENQAQGGSVVYAVFTPPYDGTDMHPLPK